MITTVTPNTLLEYYIETTSDFHGGARVDKIPYTVGGKGINVARLLKNLNMDSTALTFVGGCNGEKIKLKLKQQGINAKYINTKSETRVGVSIIEDGGKKHKWWLEEGDELEEDEIVSMIEMVKNESKESRFIAFSGSIPGIKHRNLYLRFLENIKDFSNEIYLDACGEPLLEACKIGGFFLKHNRDETLLTFQKDPFDVCNQNEYFKILASYHIKGALITNGDGLILLWDGKKKYFFEPAKNTAISTVGCGDATLGGILYGRMSEMSLIDSVYWGLAAGSADAGHKGPCEATFSEIKELKKQVKLIDVL